MPCHTLLQGFDDARDCLEIHIRHPHGYYAFFFHQVPFVGVGATAVYNFIKIVFHNLVSFLFTLTCQ